MKLELDAYHMGILEDALREYAAHVYDIEKIRGATDILTMVSFAKRPHKTRNFPNWAKKG